MEKQLKFKTDINCGGCVAKVTPLLNNAEGVNSWAVDTQAAEKVLTVQVEGIDANDIVATVKKAGFKASLLA